MRMHKNILFLAVLSWVLLHACMSQEQNDISGNESNASNDQNISYTSDRYNTLNSAAKFNGNQHISLPNTNDFHLNEVSTSVWLNLDSLNRMLFLQHDSNSKGLQLFYLDNSLVFGLANGTWTNLNAGSLEVNEWTHIVATYNGNKMKICKDGEILNQMDYTGGITYGNSFMNLGYNSFNNSSYFIGSIDQLAFYNRALTSNEIELLFKN